MNTKKNETERVKYTFDNFGNLVPETINQDPRLQMQQRILAQKTGISQIPQPSKPKLYRLLWAEYIWEKWNYFGKDTRFHILALLGIVFCFSSVYLSAIRLDDWTASMESKAYVPAEILDRRNWKEYQRNKYGLKYDPFLHFQTS